MPEAYFGYTLPKDDESVGRMINEKVSDESVRRLYRASTMTTPGLMYVLGVEERESENKFSRTLEYVNFSLPVEKVAYDSKSTDDSTYISLLMLRKEVEPESLMKIFSSRRMSLQTDGILHYGRRLRVSKVSLSKPGNYIYYEDFDRLKRGLLPTEVEDNLARYSQVAIIEFSGNSVVRWKSLRKKLKDDATYHLFKNYADTNHVGFTILNRLKEREIKPAILETQSL